jgi:NADP-dependent 3-hydroxy acid dehydrogenase YdfG
MNSQAFSVQCKGRTLRTGGSCQVAESFKENIMSGIKDKVVVIAGASSGIGEATALLLAECGAKVVLGARGPDRLEALASRIGAAGGEAAYAPTDVKRREDVSNLVRLSEIQTRLIQHRRL